MCSSLAVISGMTGYWASSMFSSGALMESSYAVAAVGLATFAVLQRQTSSAAELPATEAWAGTTSQSLA